MGTVSRRAPHGQQVLSNANKTGFLTGTENEISRRPAKGFPLARTYIFGKETVSWSEAKMVVMVRQEEAEVKLPFAAA